MEPAQKDFRERSDLSPFFGAVRMALEESRLDLNQADSLNGNHGDHMVEVFRVATRAADERHTRSLAEAMEHASSQLLSLTDNGSAGVYASGLRQISQQLRRREVTLDELVAAIRNTSQTAEETAEVRNQENLQARTGDVLKALLAGLAGWNQEDAGETAAENPLDMGAMFEFGMAYLQARQRNEERIDVLADAAASASPLRKVPHRYRSGVIAIRALLCALQSS